MEAGEVMMKPAAGTESGAPGPSEAAVEAVAARVHRDDPEAFALRDRKYTDPFRKVAQGFLEAAMDPALGDVRLVVAGDERQRIVAEVVEWLREFERTGDGHLVRHAIRIIEGKFGGPPSDS